MQHHATLIAFTLLLAHAARADFVDPVFDVPAILATPVHAVILKGPTEVEGVMLEEIQFHAEMDGDKSVDIFAFIAYPKDAKNCPAFIWNQGGLGKANTYFPILGAKRGYVAMCIDFPLPGYRSTGGYPINHTLISWPDARQAPIAHGVVALLKAVSYLESRPEVDANRIGMCGSSWGGFYTTMMIGIDARLKAGSAMFGCGFLDIGNAWWGYPGSKKFPDDEKRNHWLATLDPGPRLAHRKTPYAIFTGTNDMFYWMPSVMKTLETAGGAKHLALFPNWAHGLPPQGDAEVFEWLDVHLQNATPLTTVTPLEAEAVAGKHFQRWTFAGERKIVSADLIVSPGLPGNWLSRYWMTIPATIEGNRCIASIDALHGPCMISGNVTDVDGYRSSTPLKQIVTPGSAGDMAYNGAGMWGDFEEAGVAWLRGLAMMPTNITSDAHTGTQANTLKAGANKIYPLYFAGGIKHCFSAWLKADQACDITLNFTGAAPGWESKIFAIGTDWTPLSADVLTIDEPTASLTAILDVPAERTVILDDVQLSPCRD